MNQLNLIVAVDLKNGISKNGEIPWQIKEDSLFFLDVTKNNGKVTDGYNDDHVLIIGRKTWESSKINRKTLIVSSTLQGDNVVRSLDEAIHKCINCKIFICGGKQLYEEAMQLPIDNVYVTEIDHDFECDNIVHLNLSNYDIHFDHTFNLIDSKTNLTHRVRFTKFSLLEKVILPEQQYLDLLKDILDNGHFRQTRNSKTWSLFSKQLEFDLSKGFPLLTTKKVFFRAIFEELLYFLKGDTNSKHLEEKGINIWRANTTREFLDSVGLDYDVGVTGPLYGYNWRFYGCPYQGPDHDYTKEKGFDQIEHCLNLLKTDPYSRRIMMTTFDPSTASKAILNPCHSIIIQWYVEKDNRLSMTCYNRSQDSQIGTPFNINSSSLLIYLFCEVINNDVNYHGPKFTPGRLIMNLGDCHIYEEHRSIAIRQILREPYPFPQLKINRKVTDLTDFKFEDFELVNYQCYPNIVAKMVA